jgi:hypothetical protein
MATEPSKSFFENIKSIIEYFTSITLNETIEGTKGFLKNRASIDFNDENTIPVFIKSLKKTGLMFIVLMAVSIIMYYMSMDNNALTSKTYYYILIIIIPLVIAYIIGKDVMMPSEKTTYEPFLKAGMFLLALFFIVQGYNFVMSSPTALIFMNMFLYVLIFLIIIIGLGIGYFVFSNYLKQQTGALGLFVRILFYLPCLFADFINYLKKELSITSNTVFILLVLEIILIVLYIYLPIWIKKLNKMDENVVLYDPVDLNEEKTISGSSRFRATNLEGRKESLGDKFLNWITNKKGLNENELYNHDDQYRNSNYSISFWVYVNPSGISDSAYVKESNILKYSRGNNNTNGKPRVTYKNNGKYKGNKYVIYLSDAESNVSPFEIELENGFQKWNNFVITYHDSTANIFINSKLVRTMNFDKNNMPLSGSEFDTIIVGENNGIKGAICNVNYYPYAVTQREISTTYNFLRFKNPPKLF